MLWWGKCYRSQAERRRPYMRRSRKSLKEEGKLRAFTASVRLYISQRMLRRRAGGLSEAQADITIPTTARHLYIRSYDHQATHDAVLLIHACPVSGSRDASP